MKRRRRRFKSISSLTVGQAASMLGVGDTSVRRWIDKGMLRGHKVPGGRDRRIGRQAMLDFLAEQGLPFGNPDIDVAMKGGRCG